MTRAGITNALQLGRRLAQGLKPAFFQAVNGRAEEAAEKVAVRRPAPKGASDFEELTVSLKRYPDTNLSFSAACEAAPCPKPIHETSSTSFRRWLRSALLVPLLLTGALASAEPSAEPNHEPLDKILDRVTQRVSGFLDLFSDVKCTEQVTQEKFKPNGKVELQEQSTYDYLVIFTNVGGELSLNESRLPVKQATADRKKDISMLLSNGFATLFLVFHPYYVNSFEFTDAGSELLNGHNARKIRFQHIRNTRSVAALALRGREYPLEISGMAWVDAETGDLLRIEAGIASTLEDIGMKSLQSQVTFAPVTFHQDELRQNGPVYWFPTEAVVEVETPKQHWRNTHRFTAYKQFSVATEEHVAQK
jgi:hypothetical protein